MTTGNSKSPLQRVLDGLDEITPDNFGEMLKKTSDDALLASVMRKVLADEHGWVDFAAKDRRWQGPAWVTIDVRRIELTDEEYAAIERADQP